MAVTDNQFTDEQLEKGIKFADIIDNNALELALKTRLGNIKGQQRQAEKEEKRKEKEEQKRETAKTIPVELDQTIPKQAVQQVVSQNDQQIPPQLQPKPAPQLAQQNQPQLQNTIQSPPEQKKQEVATVVADVRNSFAKAIPGTPTNLS